MRLRAGQRLRRNADFSSVRERGRRLDCGAFLLTWAPRPGPAATAAARVGVVAARSAVGNAVQRNRAKRRLRAIYRKHQSLVPPGLDLILTARAALLRLEFVEVEKKFADICHKLARPST